MRRQPITQKTITKTIYKTLESRVANPNILYEGFIENPNQLTIDPNIEITPAELVGQYIFYKGLSGQITSATLGTRTSFDTGNNYIVIQSDSTISPGVYDDSNAIITPAEGGTFPIWEASHGDAPGPFTDKLEQCWACASTYPQDEVVYWRGRPYCPECRSDIPRLIDKEKGTRDPASGIEEEGTDFSGLVP